jgi:hypothetical protein
MSEFTAPVPTKSDMAPTRDNDQSTLIAIRSLEMDVCVLTAMVQMLAERQFGERMRHIHSRVEPDGKIIRDNSIEPGLAVEVNWAKPAAS